MSVFYIGATQRYEDLNPIDSGRTGWTLTARQYFLKFQYLIRL